MGNLKTFFWTCLGVGLVAGAGFNLYRKWTSTDGNQETPENSGTQVTVKIIIIIIIKIKFKTQLGLK